MKLIPLGDKVVLKQVEAEETTASGIILAAKTQEKPLEGIVVAVGPGGMVDGKEVTMQVKEGDKVVYSVVISTDKEVSAHEIRAIINSSEDIISIARQDDDF